MSNDNQALIDEAARRAKHWAKDERNQLPPALHSGFDSVADCYFAALLEVFRQHPTFRVGCNGRQALQVERIVCNHVRRGYKKGPARFVIRNLAASFVDTTSELMRVAIKEVFAADKNQVKGDEA